MNANNNLQNMHFPHQLGPKMNGNNNNINNSAQSPSSPHQFSTEQILVFHQQQSKICFSPLQNAEFLVTTTNQQCPNSLASSSFSSSPQSCSHCGQLIMDRHLAKIFPDRFLHENCARCSICHCQFLLTSHSTPPTKCFEREGRLFCRMHYIQCFPPPPPSISPPTICAGCGMAIEAADLVYKLKASIVFHVRCHRCVRCGCQLGQWQQIVVDERNKSVACAIHFEVHFEENILAEMIAENGPMKSGNDEGNGGIMQGRIMCSNGGGNDFMAGIVEQMQRKAQIGLEMANDAQKRLQPQIGEYGLDDNDGGDGGMSSNEMQIIANSQCGGQSQQQSSTISLNFPQNAQQQMPIKNEQQKQAENVFEIFTENPQQNLGQTIGEESDGNEHIENDQQLVEQRQKKKKSLSSSPTVANKFNNESTAILDGIVLSTVQNIKAAVENRQKEEDGEGVDAERLEAIRKKEKIGIGTAIHRRRTSSSGGNSSTNIPAQIVPQYPFEMYAVGEQFSRQEEEFQQSGQSNKRRGPRTTISQQQLDILNKIFTTTPKPTKHARAKLAMEAGLSMRVIQVWFQNRRSKERRLKHLCNFLRHYDGGGERGGGDHRRGKWYAGRMMMVKEEERSEFDGQAEDAAIAFNPNSDNEFC